MEQIFTTQNLMMVLNFILEHWDKIPTIYLAIFYIKSKSWDSLYKLAEREVIKFAEVPKQNLSNVEKHEGTISVMNTKIISKMFSQKDLDDIVATARKMTK